MFGSGWEVISCNAAAPHDNAANVMTVLYYIQQSVHSVLRAEPRDGVNGSETEPKQSFRGTATAWNNIWKHVQSGFELTTWKWFSHGPAGF